MRILILGAGGIGGYFGARIQAAGGDVTFLVRPARAAQLARDGLRVKSPFGDLALPAQAVTRETLVGTYDVVFVSCKAYDLASAIDAIAPAVGPETAVVPLLNGIRHIDTLVGRFGAERVLGGVALISVALDADGTVLHLNKVHKLVVGSRTSPENRWLAPLAELLGRCGVDFTLSGNVVQAMWDKVVFLATLAGSTCLMRASVGDIMRTLAGESFVRGLFAECAALAAASGQALSEAQQAAYLGQLTDPASGLMASMLRDVERGGPTEAEHILGDLVARAQGLGLAAPNMALAYSHLQAYDFRRQAQNS
mgnify:CR=1 FL=1